LYDNVIVKKRERQQIKNTKHLSEVAIAGLKIAGVFCHLFTK